MTLTEVLSVTQARRGWVVVRLEGEKLLIPLETAEASEVVPGAFIDADALRDEAEGPQLSDAKRYTNRYLALSERSSGQLAAKLRERGYLPGVVTGCMAWAHEYGLIDDLRYARAFAACHTLGRAGLKARLRGKGVEESAITTVLSEKPDSESTASLAALVKRKYGGIPDRETARRRAAGWLLRRGFPAGLIAAVLEKAL
ncbi:MAG: regulatory protein RecX [Candidatus Fermentibacteraceae bacterium]